uniref:Peptidase S1 domain-containing protein n=1 Tax=Zosterops lateralis melanops TaxID=1220523 RepID=A0A8D2NMT8_ZOSLA
MQCSQQLTVWIKKGKSLSFLYRGFFPVSHSPQGPQPWSGLKQCPVSSQAEQGSLELSYPLSAAGIACQGLSPVPWGQESTAGEEGQIAESSCLGRFIPPAPPSSHLHWGLFLCPVQLLLVFPGRKLNITVILGAHNIRDKERSQQRIHVRHWVIHPKYSHEGFQNDIVLLKLKPKARINKNVQLISIPRRNEHVRAGAECKVAGWGQTSVTGDTTNVMREVKLKVQNGTICQQLLKNYQPQSMICVGDDYSKKGSYKGDSGGPLICKQKAHGIVSYGR